MTPTDRDALIEEATKYANWEETQGRLKAAAMVRALISLASPSPAQTETPQPTGALAADIAKAQARIAANFGLSSRSPAQWPEDVVERAANTYEQALVDFGRSPRVGLVKDGNSAMRLALTTLPPPEDERVKGLVHALERAASVLSGVAKTMSGDENVYATVTQVARSALASYRGGA